MGTVEWRDRPVTAQPADMNGDDTSAANGTDWVRGFFNQASTWWGRPSPRESDEARAAAVRRLAGNGPHQILDLGCGGGTTAAAMARAGHTVTAVKLSSVRAGHARQLVAADPGLDVSIVEGDFFDVALPGKFDCVTYWNGFGVGSDEDQRRLLRRISTDWLTDTGVAIVDVFSPWRWAREAGTQSAETHATELVNARDFDPATSRFIDSWWPAGAEEQAVTQSARCYTPADLLLLVKGTGLVVEAAEVDGAPFEMAAAATSSSPLWDAWEYRVALRPGDREP